MIHAGQAHDSSEANQNLPWTGIDEKFLGVVEPEQKASETSTLVPCQACVQKEVCWAKECSKIHRYQNCTELGHSPCSALQSSCAAQAGLGLSILLPLPPRGMK